jgi:hypothetical protein
VQNADFTEGDSLSDEVQINLNMLGSLMLNWVGGEVDNTDVITIDHSGAAKRMVKLLQKLSQPASLSNTICHSPTLRLSTGLGHCRLMFRRPGDEIVPEEHRIARRGLARVGTSRPISICVDSQISL